MAHFRILMKPNGASTYELLGRFTADTPEELAALHAVLERHDHPYDAIPQLPHGLLRDTLQICEEAGHDVRIEVAEDS